MSQRRRSRPPGSEDFEAARARLKDIGSGLRQVFDTVNALLDETVQSEQTKTGARGTDQRGFKTHFDVRVRTLDELSTDADASAHAKPRPKTAAPVKGEEHTSPEGLMVIITLGAADPDTVHLHEAEGQIYVRCGDWAYTVQSGAHYTVKGAQRWLRNGYLTLLLSPHETQPDLS